MRVRNDLAEIEPFFEQLTRASGRYRERFTTASDEDASPLGPFAPSLMVTKSSPADSNGSEEELRHWTTLCVCWQRPGQRAPMGGRRKCPMRYRVKPEMCEALGELESRVEELRELEWDRFSGELRQILGRILISIDGETLPFVTAATWYEQPHGSDGGEWDGTIRWPEPPAERLSTQLWLLFLIIRHRSARQAFRMRFIHGSTMESENVPGYVRYLVRPVVDTFRELIKRDDVQVDPFVAEVWSGVDKGPTRVTDVELEKLRQRRKEFEHFIDCVGDRVIVEVLKDGNRVEAKLTAGEAEVFHAAFAMRPTGAFFYPENLDTKVVSKSGRPQAFKTMRTNIDAGRRGEYRLFKSRRKGEPHKLEYRFAPGKDVMWCVILPVGAKA